MAGMNAEGAVMGGGSLPLVFFFQRQYGVFYHHRHDKAVKGTREKEVQAAGRLVGADKSGGASRLRLE